jgi:hypothetical protein
MRGRLTNSKKLHYFLLRFGHSFYLEWASVAKHLYNRKPYAMKRTFLNETIAGLFIFLFMYAAFSKLSDFNTFRIQVAQSPLLYGIVNEIVWLIPAAEIVISIMLLSNRYRLAGLYGSFILMTLFSAYIIAITQFSTFVPCSCGGILQHMSWNQHLLFNIGFVGLALVGVLFYRPQSPAISTNR